MLQKTKNWVFCCCTRYSALKIDQFWKPQISRFGKSQDLVSQPKIMSHQKILEIMNIFFVFRLENIRYVELLTFGRKMKYSDLRIRDSLFFMFFRYSVVIISFIWIVYFFVVTRLLYYEMNICVVGVCGRHHKKHSLFQILLYIVVCVFFMYFWTIDNICWIFGLHSFWTQQIGWILKYWQHIIQVLQKIMFVIVSHIFKLILVDDVRSEHLYHWMCVLIVSWSFENGDITLVAHRWDVCHWILKYWQHMSWIIIELCVIIF